LSFAEQSTDADTGLCSTLLKK